MTLALAIAALALSVISLAFTFYQWRQSGPQLAIEQVSTGLSGDSPVLTAEIVSVGRLSATVNKVEASFGDEAEKWVGTWTQTGMVLVSASPNLPAKLEPSEVLQVTFALPDKQKVDFFVWVTAKSGRQWAKTRRQIRYEIKGGLLSSSISH